MASTRGNRRKNTQNDAEEETVDFTTNLVDALTDQRVITALQAAFTGLVGELKNEIAELKECIQEKDTKIQLMSTEIDELKQEQKRNSVKINGLPEANEDFEENTAEVVSNFITTKMDIPMLKWQIESVHRVGKKERGKNRPIVLRFLSHDKKIQVMKAKKKLRDPSARPGEQVYINDDLTEVRANIFKTARQAVKDKKIFSTWVFGGRIFVKIKATDNPTLVKSLSGMNAILAGL